MEHPPILSRVRTARFALAVAVLAPVVTPGQYSVRHERFVSLAIDFLDVRDGRTESLGSREIDVLPDTGGEIEIVVPWDASGATARIRLDASGTVGDPEDDAAPHRVSLHSAIVAGGRRVTANRKLALREAGTHLVDIYEDDSRRIVLAVRAHAETRPVLQVEEPVKVGAPVRLYVEVERVDAERVVPLETNTLNTFVGQSVEYSFHRGGGDLAESVRLRMLPMRLAGEVAELAVEVTGSLPGDPDRLLLSRRETIVSTRGASSALVVVSGKPPAGYRFRITPEF